MGTWTKNELNGFDPIHIACEVVTGKMAQGGGLFMQTILKYQPTAANAPSQRIGLLGWYPLHFAAMRGALKCCGALIDSGAEINQRGGIFDLESPVLRGAALKEHQNLFGKQDENEISRAEMDSELNCFLEGGEAPGGRDWGLSPLHLACFGGHRRIAQLLLNRGAILTTESTGHGWNCLHFATWSGNVDLVSDLIIMSKKLKQRPSKHSCVIPVLGLDDNWFVNATSSFADLQLTPISIAVILGNVPMIKCLLSFGADPFIGGRVYDFPGSVLCDIATSQSKTASALNGKINSKIKSYSKNNGAVLKAANCFSRADAKVTAMHWAIVKGDPFLFELLSKLANVTVSQDPLYFTAKDSAGLYQILPPYDFVRRREAVAAIVNLKSFELSKNNLKKNSPIKFQRATSKGRKAVENSEISANVPKMTRNGSGHILVKPVVVSNAELQNRFFNQQIILKQVRVDNDVNIELNRNKNDNTHLKTSISIQDFNNLHDNTNLTSEYTLINQQKQPSKNTKQFKSSPHHQSSTNLVKSYRQHTQASIQPSVIRPISKVNNNVSSAGNAHSSTSHLKHSFNPYSDDAENQFGNSNPPAVLPIHAILPSRQQMISFNPSNRLEMDRSNGFFARDGVQSHLPPTSIPVSKLLDKADDARGRALHARQMAQTLKVSGLSNQTFAPYSSPERVHDVDFTLYNEAFNTCFVPTKAKAAGNFKNKEKVTGHFPHNGSQRDLTSSANFRPQSDGPKHIDFTIYESNMHRSISNAKLNSPLRIDIDSGPTNYHILNTPHNDNSYPAHNLSVDIRGDYAALARSIDEESHNQLHPPSSGPKYIVDGQRSPGRNPRVPVDTKTVFSDNMKYTNNNNSGKNTVLHDRDRYFGLKAVLDTNLDPALVDGLVHKRLEARRRLLSQAGRSKKDANKPAVVQNERFHSSVPRPSTAPNFCFPHTGNQTNPKNNRFSSPFARRGDKFGQTPQHSPRRELSHSNNHLYYLQSGNTSSDDCFQTASPSKASYQRVQPQGVDLSLQTHDIQLISNRHADFHQNLAYTPRTLTSSTPVVSARNAQNSVRDVPSLYGNHQALTKDLMMTAVVSETDVLTLPLQRVPPPSPLHALTQCGWCLLSLALLCLQCDPMSRLSLLPYPQVTALPLTSTPELLSLQDAIDRDSARKNGDMTARDGSLPSPRLIIFRALLSSRMFLPPPFPEGISSSQALSGVAPPLFPRRLHDLHPKTAEDLFKLLAAECIELGLEGSLKRCAAFAFVMACRLEQIEFARFLIGSTANAKEGKIGNICWVDPLAIDECTGETALQAAAHSGSSHVMQLLLERGANVDVDDNEGIKPLDRLSLVIKRRTEVECGADRKQVLKNDRTLLDDREERHHRGTVLKSVAFGS